MLISLNWLKRYVDIDVPTVELVELIGARLVEVEHVIDVSPKYARATVVKVASVERIEKSDHLHLCYVDDGGAVQDVARRKDGLVQVVCGCPNVREGMLAVWLPPGAVVPETWGTEKELILATRKLAGYDSNGMLAGPDELGLGERTEYLAEVNPATSNPGDSFAELFGLDDEILLDIENKSLTHRPDCFGIIGFAREVAGILGKEFKEPEWPEFDNAASEKLEIEIKDAKICPRYSAVILKQSDGTKQERYITQEQVDLALAGMRPIDFIVDGTNIVMLQTGQPLHAFDYDKLVAAGGLSTPKIIVRNAEVGEKITLLDGKEIEMDENDIVITSNNVPVALAGAMGGANTVIDKNTKRIIVESATFSLYNLRRTQMKHGIFSEAITRFTKGQPAELTVRVLKEFMKQAQPDYVAVSKIFDEYPVKQENPKIEISVDDINSLLGTDYSYEKIEQTLRNVGFTVECDYGKNDKCECEKVKVQAPWWRTDVHIKEDVIEEVGRLNGYDSIPLKLPLREFAAVRPDELGDLKASIRRILAATGANEVLTYGFVNHELLERVGQDKENSYKIVNSISPDLEYVRQQLMPSLFEKAYRNARAGYDKFALFEMNQIFIKKDGLDKEDVPKQRDNLALVVADKSGGSGYYAAKKYLQDLAAKLGLKLDFKPDKSGNGEEFLEPKRTAEVWVNGEQVGVVGEATSAVLKKIKLPPRTAGFELDLQLLLKNMTGDKKYKKISEFPKVERDVTLKVSADMPFCDIETVIKGTLEKNSDYCKITAKGIYQGEDKTTKNVTFGLEFGSYAKTLAAAEITGIMDKLAEKIKEELKAEVI